MEVYLNNEKTETGATTLAELIAAHLPDTKGIAVAVGTTVIPRAQWETTPLEDQASITIIRATRGG